MFRRRSWSLHLALWVAACALLLKAGVPLMASASAGLQGKTLVEVCTEYGVQTVVLHDAETSHSPADLGVHMGEHCALTALAVLATPGDRSAVWQVRSAPRAPPLGIWVQRSATDAAADWVARLKHGPPTFV